MASFTDNSGNEWRVEITIHTMKQFRDRLGVDLMTVMASENVDDINAVFDNTILVVDMIYLCCEQQCSERGVSDREFGESLYGDCVLNAQKGFVEALHDFFPQGVTKLVLEMLLDNWKKIETTVSDDIQRLRNSKELKEKVASAIFGEPSTTTPESSESTQGL